MQMLLLQHRFLEEKKAVILIPNSTVALKPDEWPE
jgi:hypothetical protein